MPYYYYLLSNIVYQTPPRLILLSKKTLRVAICSYILNVPVPFTTWMNYFGVALKYNDAVEVDHWLRRRPHVLLEAVAQGEKTHRRTDQARCSEVSYDSHRVEQKGLLASF